MGVGRGSVESWRGSHVLFGPQRALGCPSLLGFTVLLKFVSFPVVLR